MTAPNELTPAVSVTEEIAADPATVFESLVDPEALQEWMRAPSDGATCDWAVDAHLGGEWSATIVAPEGSVRTLGGRIVEIDAPHRLAFTWRDSGDDDTAGVVRFTLEEIEVCDERWTRLTVTHTMSACALGTRVSVPAYWGAVCSSLASFVGEARFAVAW